jgi:hypothetical protein
MKTAPFLCRGFRKTKNVAANQFDTVNYTEYNIKVSAFQPTVFAVWMKNQHTIRKVLLYLQFFKN